MPPKKKVDKIGKIPKKGKQTPRKSPRKKSARKSPKESPRKKSARKSPKESPKG